MIGIVLHWYYLPLVVVLLIGAAISIGNAEEGPFWCALAICGFALFVRWLP
jgi:hypothetical protein